MKRGKEKEIGEESVSKRERNRKGEERRRETSSLWERREGEKKDPSGRGEEERDTYNYNIIEGARRTSFLRPSLLLAPASLPCSLPYSSLLPLSNRW